MMKKLRPFPLFLLFLNVFFSFSYAQSGFNSNGYNITKADLELSTFEKDSTAHALVIYEKGESHIDKKSFHLKTKIKRKIKILDKEGFKYAANFYPYLKEFFAEIVNTQNESMIVLVKK